MTASSKREPSLLSTTILQPVRNPGSIEIIDFLPNGGSKSRFFAFSAKTSIARRSAFFFARFLNSVSKDGDRSLSQESWMELAINCQLSLL